MVSQLISSFISLSERGYIPDFLIRFGIRALLKQRLIQNNKARKSNHSDPLDKFVKMMDQSPIALNTQDANEQHYEVPSDFFKLSLGPQLKYSCCLYEQGSDLSKAETDALDVTTERAELSDHMNILELGCGWGSLTLFMARKYSNSIITAVSNSSTQKIWIDNRASELGLKNINVITSDMRDFSIDTQFDRIISIEMFEHMRNYRQLYRRIATWLKPNGKFFKHIFTHRDFPYLYEIKSDADWMSKYLFTGGMMPSENLPDQFQEDLLLEKKWHWNGQNYYHTCNDWLRLMDTNEKQIKILFNQSYGEKNSTIWFNRWRIFYMSCAELFAYNSGEEWFITHYLFSKNG